MKYITKSLEWIPLPGLRREQIVEEMSLGASAISDKGDHVWVASLNNKGTTLFCYALTIGTYEHQGRNVGVYYVKRIPEEAGPDAYDCPIDILEMCRITNAGWRKELMGRQSEK